MATEERIPGKRAAWLKTVIRGDAILTKKWGWVQISDIDNPPGAPEYVSEIVEPLQGGSSVFLNETRTHPMLELSIEEDGLVLAEISPGRRIVEGARRGERIVETGDPAARRGDLDIVASQLRERREREKQLEEQPASQIAYVIGRLEAWADNAKDQALRSRDNDLSLVLRNQEANYLDLSGRLKGALQQLTDSGGDIEDVLAGRPLTPEQKRELTRRFSRATRGHPDTRSRRR